MKHTMIILKIIFILLLTGFPVFANNASITSIYPIGRDSALGTMNFSATLSWNNAWNGGINHDALWVFMKYLDPATSTWKHAMMSTSGLNPTGFTKNPSGYDIIVPEDKTGFFLRLSKSAGGGAAKAQTASTIVTFVWDYRSSGVDPDQVANFKLFAIEMVYIPEGSFAAGDLASVSSSSPPAPMSSAALTMYFTEMSSSGSYTRWHTGPWIIKSETAISVPGYATGRNEIIPSSNPAYAYNSAGNAGENTSGGAFTVSSQFPKGYKAFYLMKHEVSQSLYRDFLNTLPSTEAGAHCAAVSIGTGRFCDSAGSTTPVTKQNIKYINTAPTFGCDANNNGTVNQSTDGEWIAMNFMAWKDLTAFLDWAALRPMTELEYEKAARGPSTATTIANEYPWGNATSYSPATTIYNVNAINASVNQGNVNYSSVSLGYPFRVGIFATSAATRITAGAGYYGNLDLAGNVEEMVVSVGNPEGRAFQGSHGDGFLTATGFAENLDWPDSSGLGAGTRGGGFSAAASRLYISDRFQACSSSAVATRLNSNGGRGARTAPSFAAP